MLIDEVDLIIKGGHGGAGRVSFYPGKKAGPDGGNGGRGGDVYIKVTSDLTALNQFSKAKKLSAENGAFGGRNKSSGEDGADLEITFPVGTTLVDQLTDQVFELDDLNTRILLCKGGKGGMGNYELRSSRNTTPMRAQTGLPGQERVLHVNLRFIAQFGLIGLPNAGKSSLLNEITRANAKVANYAFTTLEPNLGVLNGRVIADIPGLIEGASEGRGLGIKFLKHIEKVELLLHCVSAESDDVFRDIKVVHNELEKYNPAMLEKKEIILLTKSDMVDKTELNKKLKVLKSLKKLLLPVSIYDSDSLDKLRSLVNS